MMDWMAVLMFGLLGKGRALEEEDNSVLGLVHLDLAKYHETCRLARKS